MLDRLDLEPGLVARATGAALAAGLAGAAALMVALAL